MVSVDFTNDIGQGIILFLISLYNPLFSFCAVLIMMVIEAEFISGGEVIFLVDVSGSIKDNHLPPVKRWIKKVLRFFYFRKESSRMRSFGPFKPNR